MQPYPYSDDTTADSYPMRPNAVATALRQDAPAGMNDRPIPIVPQGPQQGPHVGEEVQAAIAADLTDEQKAQLAQSSPDAQAAFWQAAATDYATRMSSAESDMSRATALRDQAGPQGATAGGVYQAGNPLAHVVSALRQRKGTDDLAAATAARDESVAGREDLTKQYFNVMDQRNAPR